MNNVILNLRPALVLTVIFIILFGGVYPLLITSASDFIFRDERQGSLIKNEKGEVIGSELLGQNFTSEKYFWGRLSATSPAYNGAASTGSNLGVNNPALLDAVKARIDALGNPKEPIPVDLVTASGSGLDPDISLEAAKFQIERVAKARGLNANKIEKLVYQYTEKRDLGILGEERVNVLKLNLALDKLNQ